MGIRHIDSCEFDYAVHLSASGSASNSATSSRRGGRCYQVVSGDGSGYASYKVSHFQVPSSGETTLYVGYAASYFCQSSYGTYPIVVFRQNGTNQVGVWAKSDGTIQIRNGDATVLDTSDSGAFTQASGYLTVDQYHYWEFMATIHASAGEVSVRINGVEVAAASGVDTLNTSNAIIDEVLVRQGTWPGHLFFHDFYVKDDGFLGDVKVHGVAPTADVDTDFTPSSAVSHYTLVDEKGAVSYSDYVTGTSGEDVRETFGFTSPTLTEAVGAVALHGEIYNSDSGTCAVALSMKSGETYYDSGEFYLGLSSGARVKSRLTTVDPQDSEEWTEAKINAVKFGVKITGV